MEGYIYSDNKKTKSIKGKTLFDFADTLNIRVPTSCRRNGECHECIVQVSSGNDNLEIKDKSDSASNSLSSRTARQRYELHLQRLEKKHEDTFEQTYVTFDQRSKEEMRTIIEAVVARKNGNEDSGYKG